MRTICTATDLGRICNGFAAACAIAALWWKGSPSAGAGGEARRGPDQRLNGGYLAPEVPNPDRDAASQALGANYDNPALLTPEKVALLVKERRAMLERFPGSEHSFDPFLAICCMP